MTFERARALVAGSEYFGAMPSGYAVDAEGREDDRAYWVWLVQTDPDGDRQCDDTVLLVDKGSGAVRAVVWFDEEERLAAMRPIRAESN